MIQQYRHVVAFAFQLIGVNVDQFHGIEIEEWSARIAEVALWLTDHLMNLKVPSLRPMLSLPYRSQQALAVL